MKKILFMLFLILCVIYACGKKNPAGPDSKSTATQTKTRTPAYTNTASPTFTVSPTITVSGTITITPSITATSTPAIRLNLQVKRDSADPATTQYLSLYFRIFNLGQADIAPERLQVRAWFYANTLAIGNDVKPDCTVFDSGGGIAAAIPWSQMSVSINQSSPYCEDAIDRKKDTEVIIAFPVATAIPPGGRLETTANYAGFYVSIGVFDPLLDDYSRMTNTAQYEDNMHFGLYLDGVLVQEWSDFSTPDAQSGREPFTWPYPTLTATPICSPTVTRTQTSTRTITATVTVTLTPIPGVDWHAATLNAGFGGRYSHGSAVLNGSMWVVGGWLYGGGIQQTSFGSADGMSWVDSGTTGLPSSSDIGCFTYDPGTGNKIWIAGNGGVWYSSNGYAWTKSATTTSTMGARTGQMGVAFGASPVKMYLIGGYASTYCNDVYTSQNGIDWTLLTGNAEFSPRTNFSAFVHNSEIWVIGGNNGSTIFNDVWHSADGVLWTRATPAAAFSTRFNHAAVSYNGKMYVIGGCGNFSATLFYNDVWSSTDGISWSLVTASAGFSQRSRHSCLVFGGKLWVIGGYNASSNIGKETWWSQ